ncbi:MULTISPECIES: type II secretion system ATPase GspE [Stutzerimonas stutzeri subgroup]|uniref:Type II secretion system protein E n=1 Tax=Stutzerimonas stutzeri CCUG 29243 TaxID=1196835 RepID=I4CZ43_STUST|nr:MULTISPECIES: type II secretion system ATPase GspE [Stutzerimonas stutzeri subgroup]CEG54221.1 general secretory pathway component, cryptic [Stutzerimonas xanthomarina]AFM35350.1 general secretion pathway protein E [Stutzerimonas stutzeri CCUG 29243]MBD3875080.1 type II secretion system ATPase GspE [Stutzerimonas kunmingensis]MCQ2038373.1 type II secretion system ATPase GspE [Stutzerimonas kunmingensis]MCQ2049035.1 type II secretion system ATPase GspE [Stutzerimonas kunmingensis]
MPELDVNEVTTLLEQPAQRRLPFAFARRHGVILLERGGELRLGLREGAALTAVQEAQRVVGMRLPMQWLAQADFDQALGAAYQHDSSAAMLMVEGLGNDLDLASLADQIQETEDLLEQEDDAPIIRLINAILGEAINENASDIHIETFEKRLVIRFRVDGILREVVQPKRELAALLVSRIKVMAKLDIAEKRIPQDGRISLRVGGREVDIRVSTLPSANGERVVLRLLDKQAGRLTLRHLGMNEQDRDHLERAVKKPHGIILVTGPTGSGKTTTLYAALTTLNDRTRNILTVEDPIEYHLEGIGQTQVNTKVDMTFARGLRAILRQDPDVVMVGEIRDQETADMAVQASLTGHLVLSTLHTNSAIGAVTRLVDMGVEPFLISSSLLGVLAQRLVRVLCNDCKRAYVADAAECELLGASLAEAPTLYHAEGCEQCRGLGYRGRTGIYELVLFDDALRTMVHTRASEQDMLRHARVLGPSIRDDGLRKVREGVTTIEEVLRVTREE